MILSNIYGVFCFIQTEFQHNGTNVEIGGLTMSRLYLVTGATGHLGNTIVRILLEAGDRVRVLVHPEDDLESIRGLPVEIIYGDVVKKESMKEFFEIDNPREAIVIHADEVISFSDQKDATIFRVNVQGTVSVTDMCVKKHIGRLVYVGSVHAIPVKPKGTVIEEVENFNRELVVGDYAKSKAEAAQYILSKVKLNSLNAVIVHPSGTIGPNDYKNSPVVQLIRNYFAGEMKATERGGYDIADVRDVAAGVISAAERGIKGTSYILSNQFISAKVFFDDLNALSGNTKIKKAKKIRKPRLQWLKRRKSLAAGARPRVMQKSSPAKQALFALSPDARYSHRRADHELHYKTRDFHTSIKETVLWIGELEKNPVEVAEVTEGS